MILNTIAEPMTTISEYVAMPDVHRMLGKTNNAIRWAVMQGIVEPIRIGCYSIFTKDDVETLREHFENKKNDELGA